MNKTIRILLLRSVRLTGLILFLLVTAYSSRVNAQQETGQVASPLGSVTRSVAAVTKANDQDERYRIGPGDVLDIRVFNRPLLSRDAVRVDGRGMIRMPLLEEEIDAACRTEGELAQEIAKRYLKYQRNPNVEVFVKDYNSQPVAVIGAVARPGQFRLQRRVRLLELLTYAGGPAERSGSRLNIVHAPARFQCSAAKDGQLAEAQKELEALTSYNLNDTLRGVDEANPYVEPGDIIDLPEADQVFIVGNIERPRSIPLKDQPITVSMAVAMAGGTLPDTKTSKIRVIRQTRGSAGKIEILVDLEAIKKHRAEDIALLANDIVEVPTAGGKRLLRSLIGGVVSSGARLPVQIIR